MRPVQSRLREVTARLPASLTRQSVEVVELFLRDPASDAAADFVTRATRCRQVLTDSRAIRKLHVCVRIHAVLHVT